ncbi:MAG: hypothetical protein EDS66_10105 [Planctomycetota bacterium]|nr:MAG: hypothetical protein EDS66_10105 [Planctomycetota bacterium]MCQ3919953.1 hypothetical protein [Planctomycetota bacterium]
MLSDEALDRLTRCGILRAGASHPEGIPRRAAADESRLKTGIGLMRRSFVSDVLSENAVQTEGRRGCPGGPIVR